jgi:hypothetical protein
MKNRNPGNPHIKTEANAKRTQKVIETYQGKNDLLRTWELLADTPANHSTILQLRKKVRTLRNLLLHRADPSAII